GLAPEPRGVRGGGAHPPAAAGPREDARDAPGLRGPQGRAAPARLRRRAAGDGRHGRVGAAGRRAGAGAVPLLRHRRVPRRLAPAALPVAALARGPPRRVRRWRREPDDLLLRWRLVPLPAALSL